MTTETTKNGQHSHIIAQKQEKLPASSDMPTQGLPLRVIMHYHISRNHRRLLAPKTTIKVESTNLPVTPAKCHM